MRRFLPLIAIACCTLTACQTTGSNYQPYLDKKGLAAPIPDSFPHCRAYGCKKTDTLSLFEQDWQEIGNFFTTVNDAETERAAIGRAIGLFERKVGALNGTSADKAGTFAGVGAGAAQHDCVDESINTTIYLALLEKQGWLYHHTVSPPVSRTPVTTMFKGKLWPHQTAVITDTETGERYAVDSWFYDNGHDAEIVPLGPWYRGWSPQK
ncbi:MAG: hypothetical protein H6868_09715 [Rhodospirillales bacterium]|nr:hypothetical protein [Rhodospirillales bacterium]